MTVDEGISYILRHSGFRGADEGTYALAEMNLARTLLENDAQLSRPWFLLTEIADATTTAGEERMCLPGDFLAEYEEGAVWLYDSTAEAPWIELKKDAYDFLKEKQQGEGTPAFYAVRGSYLSLFQTPDDVYTIKMAYYAASSAYETGGSERDWLKHAPDVLLGRAGQMFAESVRDAGAVAFFTGLEQRGLRRLLVQLEEREHANRQYVMGGDD